MTTSRRIPPNCTYTELYLVHMSRGRIQPWIPLFACLYVCWRAWRIRVFASLNKRAKRHLQEDEEHSDAVHDAPANIRTAWWLPSEIVSTTQLFREYLSLIVPSIMQQSVLEPHWFIIENGWLLHESPPSHGWQRPSAKEGVSGSSIRRQHSTDFLLHSNWHWSEMEGFLFYLSSTPSPNGAGLVPSSVSAFERSCSLFETFSLCVVQVPCMEINTLRHIDCHKVSFSTT